MSFFAAQRKPSQTREKHFPLIDMPEGTVFYTMSVYFLAAKVTKTRCTLTRALLVTLAGTVESVVLAGWMGKEL